MCRVIEKAIAYLVNDHRELDRLVCEHCHLKDENKRSSISIVFARGFSYLDHHVLLRTKKQRSVSMKLPLIVSADDYLCCRNSVDQVLHPTQDHLLDQLDPTKRMKSSFTRKSSTRLTEAPGWPTEPGRPGAPEGPGQPYLYEHTDQCLFPFKWF